MPNAKQCQRETIYDSVLERTGKHADGLDRTQKLHGLVHAHDITGDMRTGRASLLHAVIQQGPDRKTDDGGSEAVGKLKPGTVASSLLRNTGIGLAPRT
jgi:hypothetical protein